MMPKQSIPLTFTRTPQSEVEGGVGSDDAVSQYVMGCEAMLAACQAGNFAEAWGIWEQTNGREDEAGGGGSVLEFDGDPSTKLSRAYADFSRVLKYSLWGLLLSSLTRKTRVNQASLPVVSDPYVELLLAFARISRRLKSCVPDFVGDLLTPPIERGQITLASLLLACDPYVKLTQRQRKQFKDKRALEALVVSYARVTREPQILRDLIYNRGTSLCQLVIQGNLERKLDIQDRVKVCDPVLYFQSFVPGVPRSFVESDQEPQVLIDWAEQLICEAIDLCEAGGDENYQQAYACLSTSRKTSFKETVSAISVWGDNPANDLSRLAPHVGSLIPKTLDIVGWRTLSSIYYLLMCNPQAELTKPVMKRLKKHGSMARGWLVSVTARHQKRDLYEAIFDKNTVWRKIFGPVFRAITWRVVDKSVKRILQQAQPNMAVCPVGHASAEDNGIASSDESDGIVSNGEEDNFSMDAVMVNATGVSEVGASPGAGAVYASVLGIDRRSAQSSPRPASFHTPTHYDCLNVPKDATPALIQDQYLKLLLTATAVEAVNLQQAYTVLHDAIQREAYDAAKGSSLDLAFKRLKC